MKAKYRVKLTQHSISIIRPEQYGDGGYLGWPNGRAIVYASKLEADDKAEAFYGIVEEVPQVEKREAATKCYVYRIVNSESDCHQAFYSLKEAREALKKIRIEKVEV